MRKTDFSNVFAAAWGLVIFVISFSVLLSIPFAYSQISNPVSQNAVAIKDDKLDNADVIKDIKIEGNRIVETELIKKSIKTQIGNRLSPEMVKGDVKRIYELGYFEDVSVEVEKGEDGVVLYYVVDEKPVIVDIRIRGNEEIKSEDIEEVLSIKEMEVADLRDILSSKKSIEELYSERGFVGTEVDYDIDPLDVGRIGVTYTIHEGKVAYIKSVDIEGNKNISDKYILKRIYSRPKGFLSFITQKGLFNIEEIKRDSERIRAIYLDKGYLDAKVSPPSINYDEDKEGYRVVFKVEEGKQYRVEDISLSGELIAEESELLSLLKLKPGKVFSSFKLSEDIATLTTYYGNHGFAFANVAPNIRVNKESLTVDIEFEMETGEKVFIRYIDILGNVRTRDKVIRRELSLQEQEPYNASKLQKIKKEVIRLGFFENNVQVNTERVEGKRNKLDVDVTVEEKPTGFFSVSAGFSSVEKILFAGQIQESNFLGYGKRLSLNGQIGGVTQILSLNYQDPYFFDTFWTFDISAFFTDRAFRDFDRKAYGFTVGIGRRIYKDLRIRVSYRLENQNIKDVDRDARLVLSENERMITSISLGFIWDSRDNLLDPTSGNLTRTFLEYAGPLGGDTDFIKYTFSSIQWIPFWKETYFRIAGRYGILDAEDLGNDLLVGERFFLGGPNSLRGFAYRRVGPRVPTEDGGFVIIGGVQQLLVQVDYIFPILSSAGLRGALFFDIGNAFNDGEDLTINPGDLRKDVGFGFRWQSPLGPLRLDVGFPIGERLPGEDVYEVQFSVGNIF